MSIKLQKLAEEIRKEDLNQQYIIQKQAEEIRTLRETLDHKKSWQWTFGGYPTLFGEGVASNAPPRTASGFEYSIKYKAPKPLETKELEVRLQRLAAHLTKRSKENAKRAKKLDNNQSSWEGSSYSENSYYENQRSAYYFSGKSESYENAAAKVLGLLNQAAPEPPVPAPVKAEKWIVECRSGDKYPWLYSAYNSNDDGQLNFASKEEAEESYSVSLNKMQYRARSVGVKSSSV